MVTVAFFSEQQLRQRFADDVRAAHHHRIKPGERSAHSLGKFDAADRRTRRERRQARRQPSGIERMKAVDVLVRVDGGDHVRCVDLLRQRHLHQNAMDGAIGIEPLHQRYQFVLARGRGKMKVERLHAGLDHCARLAADIGLARGFSPTRTTANPGLRPCAPVRRRVSAATAARRSAAMALPSMIRAAMI